MMLGNLEHLEYLDYFLHLHCYNYNVSADMSFDLLQLLYLSLSNDTRNFSWIRKEKQMDQRTGKLMTMHKVLHPRVTLTDYKSRNEEGRGLASIKDSPAMG